MFIRCQIYDTADDAHAAVARLLDEGHAGDAIRVLMGEPDHDHRDEPVGAFAGPGGATGSFAGEAPHGTGSFAGDAAEQRRGGFGDIDRETVTSYEHGVPNLRIASHRDLKALLTGAGLDPAAAEKDVAALHAGRTLVLVQTD